MILKWWRGFKGPFETELDRKKASITYHLCPTSTFTRVLHPVLKARFNKLILNYLYWHVFLSGILIQSWDNRLTLKPFFHCLTRQFPASSPTPNISTQVRCSALLSRVVWSSLGPSPSFSSNCLNIMCFPMNCPPNLIQSGLWALFGFRLPFAHRPQSNYCSRGDTRDPSLARAFFGGFSSRRRYNWCRRLNGVARHDVCPDYGFNAQSQASRGDVSVNGRERTTRVRAHAHRHTHTILNRFNSIVLFVSEKI